MSYKYCCDDFEAALKPHTDNEEYSQLIEGRAGEWHTGARLPPISFCPWCGVKLRPPPPNAIG